MENNYCCGPSTSTAQCPDDGLIKIDISKDEPIDSETDIIKRITAEMISSTESNSEKEDCVKLTLAYEKLFEIPRTIVERFSEYIIYLDISHNKITNLDPLVHFKHLTSLIADNNPITENCILPPLPKLQLLWLNHCKILLLYPWVGKLKESCPNIEHLCLMGNPAAPSFLNGGTFYEYLQYRLFVISQFSSLTHLDDRKVTEDQKSEAQRLYKRPFFERLVRPNATGLSIMNNSLSWSGVHNKLAWLLGKDRQERNLFI